MKTPLRPNILWVSFEDTNPFYGCYGDKVARTPNVDRLAREGCRYTNAFSTAGVCAPARSAIITGMYPTSIGTHHMRTTHRNPHAPELPTPYAAVPPHYVKCFPEYLRAHGYFCTNNDKTDYQFEAPLTTWDECSPTAHWRNRRSSDQPFFSVFNPTVTHESGMWSDKGVPTAFDPDAITLPPYFPDTPKVRAAMARMYANIETADRYLGELLAQLEADGLAENTIVMHWSDHGPLPRGKRWCYDSGIHVPLIIRAPGMLESGSISDQLISTLDLGPTVLSLAGLQVPHHVQGRAFLGPQKTEPRELIFAARDRFDESYDMVRAARDKRYKYILNCCPELPYLLWIPYRNRHPIMEEMWQGYLNGTLDETQLLIFAKSRSTEELYDIVNDPWEVCNLADDPQYSKHLKRLRKAVDDWRNDAGDMGHCDEAEMVRRWYPNGKQLATAPVRFVPIADGHLGTQAVAHGSLAGAPTKFRAPAKLQLYCATQGASIAYALGDDEPQHWLLYSGLIDLPIGKTTVHAKATRIGYIESETASVTFTVTSC